MAGNDFYASLFGASYSSYMERPFLGRLIGRLVWSGDARRYYESMAAIAETQAGGTVVDCPCGAGPALRALPSGKGVRYFGFDLSPSMIRRARKKARKRNLANISLAEADATSLPFADAEADLFLSYWGLHCFDDPAAAVMEAARVLKPDGRLIGSAFVLDVTTRRQRLLLRPHTADFGPIGTQAEIERWIGDAGFNLTRSSRSGPFFFFEATRSPQAR